MKASIRSLPQIPGSRRRSLLGSLNMALQIVVLYTVLGPPARAEAPQRLEVAPLTASYQEMRTGFEKEWIAAHGPTSSSSTSSPQDHWPLVPRDDSRMCFFIPEELARLELSSASPSSGEAIRATQISYATQLTNLIQKANPSVDRGLLYRWTHEVLALDPSNSLVRRWLRLPPSEHSRSTSRATIRHPRRPHARFGWQPDSYLTLDTRHYRITTNDTEQSARSLAEHLEALYCVWHQQFHRLWNSAGAPRTRALHQIVLFRNHEEYLAHIKTIEPQAEVTRGYYHGATRTAYFVGGERPPIATWYHEATHQLFHERTKTDRHVGAQHNFWIIEGIALYFESFDRQANRVTLGGLEADRLQFARYRALRDGSTEPLEVFASWNQQQWQTHPRIHANYSQAAGLTHFLMHAEGGKYRPAIERLLELVYTGQDQPDSLLELTQCSWQELQDQYIRFLRLTDDQLKSVPSYVRPRQLSLGGTLVTDEGIKSLHLDECEWLDLFGLKVSDSGMTPLESAHRLRQLNLENTPISDTTVSLLSAKASLVELDLSNTRVTNKALSALAQFHALERLWLTNTQVTDEGVQLLTRLPHLQLLELTSTPTSVAVRAEWAQRQQNSASSPADRPSKVAP